MTTKNTPEKTQGKTSEKEPTPACLVRAAGPSVRVAGHRFGTEPVHFAAGELSAEQLAILLADTRVAVLPVPEPKGDG